MQIEGTGIKKWINYFFPPDLYPGKKITDITWIRLFLPFAPYTSIIACISIVLWGLLGNPGKPFLMTPQGAISFVVFFFALIFLRISEALKKKKRSPAISLLIANFFPLQALLGLSLVIGFTSSLRKKFDEERHQTSQMIENVHKERKALLAQLTKEKEEQVKNHFDEIQKSLRAIDDSIPDLMKMKPAIYKWIDKCWEEALSGKRMKEMLEASAENSRKRDEKLKEEREQWIKENFRFRLKSTPK